MGASAPVGSESADALAVFVDRDEEAQLRFLNLVLGGVVVLVGSGEVGGGFDYDCTDLDPDANRKRLEAMVMCICVLRC